MHLMTIVMDASMKGVIASMENVKRVAWPWADVLRGCKSAVTTVGVPVRDKSFHKMKPATDLMTTATDVLTKSSLKIAQTPADLEVSLVRMVNGPHVWHLPWVKRVVMASMMTAIWSKMKVTSVKVWRGLVYVVGVHDRAPMVSVLTLESVVSMTCV